VGHIGIENSLLKNIEKWPSPYSHKHADEEKHEAGNG